MCLCVCLHQADFKLNSSRLQARFWEKFQKNSSCQQGSSSLCVIWAILFRNSYGLVVTICGFIAYIVLLLYHYIVSTASGAGEQNLDLMGHGDEDGADDNMLFFQQIFIMPIIMCIFVLTPFARNHKLR